MKVEFINVVQKRNSAPLYFFFYFITKLHVLKWRGEDAELWRNRKGFFSINVQCVVNSHLEIMDLVARWPGSAHDSTIFANSRIKHRFENFECGNGLLLGDRGYRNERYLMTPLASPNTPAEVLFNEAHIRTRCMVERCFGIWGRTFAVLTIGSRFSTPERTINVILSTAVLYNIIRRDRKVMRGGLQNYLQIPEVYSSPTNDDRHFLLDNYFERTARLMVDFLGNLLSSTSREFRSRKIPWNPRKQNSPERNADLEAPGLGNFPWSIPQ
ncbi:putative nuclease HARBI1 [Prorops nasuta]|uniref:putative nuclease HARBI1 n=1 Tax=Prorops nasuta TaxID=863751 RepID=UPI0034CE57D7